MRQRLTYGLIGALAALAAIAPAHADELDAEVAEYRRTCDAIVAGYEEIVTLEGERNEQLEAAIEESLREAELANRRTRVLIVVAAVLASSLAVSVSLHVRQHMEGNDG